MSGTTDFVGVRTFDDLLSTTAKIDTRDSTVLFMAVPAPAADNTAFPIGQLTRLSTDDAVQVAKLGAGIALDAVNQIASEGIVCDIAFCRVQHSVLSDVAAKLAAETNSIVGSASAKTGVWSALDAKAQLGIEPGAMIFPGYTSQRTGSVANAVVTAASAVAAKIVDCVVIVDTPTTSREDAVTYAADFDAALNVIAIYPNAIVNLGSGNVVRPASPNVAAAMIKNDKANGNPYKAFWNKPLMGVLGPSVPVGYTDGEITSDANYLNQRGVGTFIEGNLLWAPFTTATDPTVVAWRSIKRIRTRRAVQKAYLRPLRLYAGQDITPHMVSLIYRSLDDFLSDLVTLGALIDYELLWSSSMNAASILEAGALRVKARWAETPELVDLQIYTEPMPEAFDVLEANIAAALSQLGLNNVRVTA